MRQFRDNYSGALVFTKSPSERKNEDALNEIREIRDEIKAERKRIEELQQRGEEDVKQDTDK